MKDEILQVPIGEQEHLKEFFRLLNENGHRRDTVELSDLVSQLSQLEQQYAAVFAELQTVRGQLDRIQDKGIKNTVSKGVTAIQKMAIQGREQVNHIKADLSQKISDTLAAVKQHGISALNKATDFMGIKAALNDLKSSLQSSIDRTQKSIDRINAIGSELHALNEHTKNLGRALTGKETKELTKRNEDKGVLAAIAKPLKHSKALFEGMEKSVSRALESVDRLEQSTAKGREKSSIRQELKAAKRQENAPKRKAPQKAQETSL